MSSVGERVRLAELVALLSLGTDLGLGQPMEHMIRACLIALRLGERLGLAESERGVVYYSGLLAWVGCHTDAYEQAKWFGDDMTLKSDAHYHYDMGRVGPAISFVVRHVGGPERSLAARARVGIALIGDRLRVLKALAENHYRATDELVGRLGLGEDVRESLRQTYERWDGKGAYGMKGEEIALSSRLINLADVVEVFGRAGGIEAAVVVARERSGTQFDPELVDAFCEQAPMVLTELDQAPSWEAVISAEPALGREIAGAELDLALEAIGEFAELKSPSIMGHVHAVRSLVTEAATSFGLPDADLTELRRGSACMTWAGSESRTRSGTSPARSPAPSWNGSAPTHTWASGCSRSRPRLRAWARSRSSIMSDSTAPAIPAACPAIRSGRPYGCWPRPTCTRRYASRVRTGRLGPRGTRRASCAERSPPGGSTATRLTVCCGPPVTGSAAVANGPRALRDGRSRCSGCRLGGCRTSRSARSL
jgi:hypothetical protein